MTSDILTALRADRMQRAGDMAAAAGLELLLVTPGADLRYFLGTARQSLERLTCLVLPAEGHPSTRALVTPRLEAPELDDLPFDQLGVEVITWLDDEDPYEAIRDISGRPTAVGVVDTMPAVHAFRLRDAMPWASQRLAGPVLRSLRMFKDADEVEQLREAAAANDRVHARMGDFLKAGRTEAQASADIAAAMVEEGHAEASFVIVGSGPNGASPHHDVSDRVIQKGDFVVVDIAGALPSGYHSDCTRTYVIGGKPDKAAREAYGVLQKAQESAVAAVQPDVLAGSIDAAARELIDAAGLGNHFLHRTGHGIGLSVHEEPYIVRGNPLTIATGMAFSVEPGIYFDGEWGARIEDIVIVTDQGCERLNSQPRDITVF
jgi:Xaa-Pro dipeptidase